MACLKLVTRSRIKELKSQKGERRKTAGPKFSYVHGHHASAEPVSTCRNLLIKPRKWLVP